MTTDESTLRAARLRTILCGATLAMVAFSWPLWIDLADFPAVPFVPWFPEYDRSWSWLGLVAIVTGLALGMTRFGRVGVGLTIPTMGWLILGDQLRFQPWVYQFLVLGSLLVILPPRWALGFGRVWMASVYFHSGLSKLDASFLHDMGPLFVRTFVRVLHLGGVPAVVGLAWNEWVSLAMPTFEIVMAFLVLMPRTRRLGYAGLALIHVSLLVILGPWGLGHSTIVLVWNVTLAAEEFVLFWRVPVGPAIADHPGDATGRGVVRSSGPYEGFGARKKLVAVPFVILMVLPFFERTGLFDSWPSHALYAGHAERVDISLSGDLPEAWPRDLRIAAVPTAGGSAWVVHPTDWTRRVRGVPAYPQARYQLGLAEWAVARIRPGEVAGVMTTARLRADPWTGLANTLSARHLKVIRDLADTFWFNARPRDRSDRRAGARD